MTIDKGELTHTQLKTPHGVSPQWLGKRRSFLDVCKEPKNRTLFIHCKARKLRWHMSYFYMTSYDIIWHHIMTSEYIQWYLNLYISQFWQTLVSNHGGFHSGATPKIDRFYIYFIMKHPKATWMMIWGVPPNFRTPPYPKDPCMEYLPTLGLF